MFRWRYFSADGSRAGQSEPFENREAAEEWMGTAWSDLLSAGVESAALVDAERDRTLYRMGLRAE
jgi:hypothetical protein